MYIFYLYNPNKGKTMQDILLYQKSYVRLEYRADGNYIRFLWEGFVQTEEFIQTMNDALELMKQTKATSFLSNQQRRKVLTGESSEFFIKEWYPRMLAEVGKSKVAIVEAESIFGSYAFRTNVTKITNEDIPITPYHFFKTEEEAIEWLKKKE